LPRAYRRGRMGKMKKREIEWLLKEKYEGKLTEAAKKDIEKLKSEEPIDYLIGFVEFLGSKIDLSQRPFIPRPETEYWLEKAIKEIEQKTKNKKQRTEVLDIFAGSGCIGIAILKQIKNVRVDFGEIERKFLKQIKINLKLNRINKKRYRIIRSDIFDKIKEKVEEDKSSSSPFAATRVYDYIFANPPYVAKQRLKEVQKSVLNFEPKNSFFGRKTGLFYIKKFLKEAKSYLKKTGKIYLEFDPRQKEEILKILNDYKYSNYQIHRDQYGKWRYLIVDF